jgi:hypothetical protein
LHPGSPVIRRTLLTLSITIMAALPAAAQAIFADGFETGDTSRWSDTVGLRFALGHRSVTWVDASRSNRSVPAEVYYPAEVAGDDVPVAPGSFPVVVCGHGFTMDASSPVNVAEAMVPHGYIVVLPDTETTIFFPSHADFGMDIAFLARTLQDEGRARRPPSSVGWPPPSRRRATPWGAARRTSRRPATPPATG